MKKFIAAFDGLSFSESTMQYAINIAKRCHAHLVGVFLEDFTRHSYSFEDITLQEGQTFDKRLDQLDEIDQITRNKAIDEFEEECKKSGIEHSVHRDTNIAIQELLHESIYADLLIINQKEDLSYYSEPLPSLFIKTVMADSECPVILVPDRYQKIEKIIFLYNGSPSSVYAVKSFSYLFEDVEDIDVQVLTIKSKQQNLHLPDSKLIKEFMKRHYPNAEYIVIKGVVNDSILKHVHLEKRTTMVVLGAYNRGKLSRLFKPSMADMLMIEMDHPLFVSHR